MTNRAFYLVLAAITGLAAAAVLVRDDLGAKAATVTDANVACSVQWVHDGDTLRCAGYSKSTRLYGIDAPEMPGACRKGRDCTPGDPYASRDHLKGLIVGQAVRCRHLETDRYHRPVMRCWVGSTDLSCAMVRDGYAVERYGWLDCP